MCIFFPLIASNIQCTDNYTVISIRLYNVSADVMHKELMKRTNKVAQDQSLWQEHIES